MYFCRVSSLHSYNLLPKYYCGNLLGWISNDGDHLNVVTVNVFESHYWNGR